MSDIKKFSDLEREIMSQRKGSEKLQRYSLAYLVWQNQQVDIDVLKQENEKLKDSVRAIGIKNKTLENEKSLSHKTLEVYAENKEFKQKNEKLKEFLNGLIKVKNKPISNSLKVRELNRMINHYELYSTGKQTEQ